mmetsp:Transcript_7265/g.15867  ORF Transcript_7265/g.15867 Transcript_7265/m.15867 type:complete len:217 (-) Transcript_7265:699-1349(-)
MSAPLIVRTARRDLVSGFDQIVDGGPVVELTSTQPSWLFRSVALGKRRHVSEGGGAVSGADCRASTASKSCFFSGLYRKLDLEVGSGSENGLKVARSLGPTLGVASGSVVGFRWGELAASGRILSTDSAPAALASAHFVRETTGCDHSHERVAERHRRLPCPTAICPSSRKLTLCVGLPSWHAYMCISFTAEGPDGSWPAASTHKSPMRNEFDAAS